MATRAHDAEAVVIDFLQRQLDVPVSLDIVEGADTFVRVERSGGVATTRVTDNPSVMVECYAPDSMASIDLLTDVRELFSMVGRNSPIGAHVYRVDELTGPAILPDPRHTSHRRTMTFGIHWRNAKSTRSFK